MSELSDKFKCHHDILIFNLSIATTHQFLLSKAIHRDNHWDNQIYASSKLKTRTSKRKGLPYIKIVLTFIYQSCQKLAFVNKSSFLWRKGKKDIRIGIGHGCIKSFGL